MAKPPRISNVDEFKITWDNTQFYVHFKDVFGKGARYIFPPEDIEKLRDGMTEALARYRRGETSD